MAIDRRQRRRRRLTILAAGLLLAVLGIAGLWFFQQGRQAAYFQDLREQGLAAHERGDHAATLQYLEEYFQTEPEDPEALAAAARASFESPEPDNRHLAKARRWASQARQLDPQNAQANDLMLELAEKYLTPTEAINVANDILGTNPDRVDALRVRAIKHARVENFEAAKADFQAYLAKNPDDHQAHLRLLQVRSELHEPHEDLLADANALLEKHPDDPRYELVLGMVHAMTGDTDAAREWVRTASQRPVADEDLIESLTTAFDRLGLYPDASEYLARVADDYPLSDTLGVEVTRRLFEAGEFAKLLERLKGLTNDDPAELWAIRAMTQHELKQFSAAFESLRALREHPGPAGALWADALEAFYAQPRVVADALDAGEEALRKGVIHPYLLMMLGRLHASVKDHHASIEYQNDAAELRPSWAAPLLLASQDYLVLNQWLHAERYARAASRRRPDLTEPHVIRALAKGNNPETIRAGETGELIEYIDRILERVPREERLLLMRTQLLAADQRPQDAVQAGRDLLALDPPLTPGGLRTLMQISEKFRLGLEQNAARLLNDAYGSSPEMIFDDAIRLADAGQPQQGLTELEQRLDTQTVDGQLIRARYLAHIGDPEAKEIYKSVAAANPNQLDVQLKVLASPVARDDRALADQLIERIKSLAGERSTQWRLERARWHLSGPNPAADAPNAEALLDEAIGGNPNDAEAFILRARAKELQGRLSSAVEDAQSAYRIRPDASAIALELARFEQATNNFPEARRILTEVGNNPNLAPDTLRRTTAMLAAQGDYEIATQLLEQLLERPGFDTTDRLLLARLYAQANRKREAEWQITELLKNPTREAVVFASDYYGEVGQLDKARGILASLGNTGTPADQQLVLEADFAARFESPDRAAALYEAAAEANPTDPQGWVRLASFHAFRGDADPALVAARRGLHEAGDVPGLAAFVARESDVAPLVVDPAFRALVAAMLTSDEFRGVATEASRYLARARNSNDDGPTIARGLRRIADAHPDFLALQIACAQVYLRIDQPESAAEVARRAAAMFPGSIEAAHLHALALANTGQWEQTLLAAQQWRKRAARDPFAADLLAARALLRVSRPDQALSTLEPYAQRVSANPTHHAEYAAAYGEALVRNARPFDAQQFLQPQLRHLGEWRLAWLRLTMQVIRDAPTRKLWLDIVTPMVPADAFTERFALAEAWWTLHWQNPESVPVERSAEIIAQAVQLPDATPMAHFLHGVIAENVGQTAVARQAYETALEQDPGSSVTRNNLAMLLIETTQEQDHALQLARDAVAAEPNNANFRDTLAIVQARIGQLDEAIANIQAAIDLEPQNPLWKQRLAELLKQSGSDGAGMGLSAAPVR